MKNICIRCGEKINQNIIIRTHYVCYTCFDEIKKENKILMKKGKKIPNYIFEK